MLICPVCRSLAKELYYGADPDDGEPGYATIFCEAREHRVKVITTTRERARELWALLAPV